MTRAPSGAPTCSPFFVFDVESIGLHGQAFAFGGGIYTRYGEAIREFAVHCSPNRADGELRDREWVAANVSVLRNSEEVETPRAVRSMFWRLWVKAKAEWPDIVMAVECGWPVEARFLAACVADNAGDRCWNGPYPLHEIASMMLAAGMDPMATYDRLPGELPAHEPRADSRLSMRLLATALNILENAEPIRGATGPNLNH